MSGVIPTRIGDVGLAAVQWQTDVLNAKAARIAYLSGRKTKSADDLRKLKADWEEYRRLAESSFKRLTDVTARWIGDF